MKCSCCKTCLAARFEALIYVGINSLKMPTTVPFR